MRSKSKKFFPSIYTDSTSIGNSSSFALDGTFRFRHVYVSYFCLVNVFLFKDCQYTRKGLEMKALSWDLDAVKCLETFVMDLS